MNWVNSVHSWDKEKNKGLLVKRLLGCIYKQCN